MARPVSPISATVWPLLDHLADLDEILGVVRVARHVAVAVVDLDHLAVAVALAPTRSRRRPATAMISEPSLAGEVDALVHRRACR